MFVKAIESFPEECRQRRGKLVTVTVLKSAILLLLCNLLMGTGEAADLRAPAEGSGAESAELRREIEAAAESYSHFATADIVTNRPMREWPKALVAEQSKLLETLRIWARQPETLRGLIGHPNPRVRTLVLGALFVREDPHDLPLIVSRISDPTPTFPHLHRSESSVLFIDPEMIDLKEIITSQTVGNVAKAMLTPYLRASRCPSDQFDAYWLERKERTTCAGWFMFKMDRATRRTTPIQDAYRKDIQRVLAELQDLPVSELAWTQVYLRCFSFTELKEVLTDEMCLSALKKVGPDEIVRFLKRELVMSDPDLRFNVPGKFRRGKHLEMSHFLLPRACALLRPEDAPVLLKCEDDQRETPGLGSSPAWAAAAAELTAENDSTAAVQILDAALKRFPRSAILGGEDQAVLVGALWRIQGAKEKHRIADWFYDKADDNPVEWLRDGSDEWLRVVRKADRADTNEMMAALVADPRFDKIPWQALQVMLEIANDGLPKPLVDRREIYNVLGPVQTGQAAPILAQWRELLRHQYPE
jgi:hypothetical protein